MEDDNEFKKLPVEERCVHKLWKARVNGYEEATKLFRQIDDEKSPEWNKYLGLLKKFVTDSNAVGQEKGLEATLAFIENAAVASKTVGEVMSGIVLKCIAAPKTKTRELAVQITLMYVEIEKHEIVMEELFKGMDQKNPKIVSACIAAAKLALQEFGSKVIAIKPLVKKIPVILSDRDKAVRDEGKALVVEMFRWVGAALRPQLSTLQPVQVTELETEFDKVRGTATPTRYLRSQQQKRAAVAAQAAENSDAEEEEEGTAPAEVDPYDLMDPVDILSKLPNDFYEKVEAKKWQERKEAVEAVETLLKAMKLQSGDYGDLVRALKKIVAKDTNVMIIALAGKCIAALAAGLKKRFQPYASACVSTILEKFREKKPNVVAALREAIDAVFLSTSIESILDDVVEALNNKNPAVKAETAAFLSRAFCRCQPTALTKKLLKEYTTILLKTLNEPDPIVRDNAAEALGTIMKLVGEKQIAPFVTEVDNLKMAKIKECCEKAVILVKIVAPKKERPNTAPAKVAAAPKAGSSTAKPVKRPASAAVAKKKPAAKPKAASYEDLDAFDIDDDGMGDEAAAGEQVTDSDGTVRIDISPQITESLINELSDKNWKVRNEALIKIAAIVSEAKFILPSISDLAPALAPRLTDSNSKIAQTTLNLCESLAVAMGPACKQHARALFPGFLQGMGDSKTWIRSASLSCMNAWGEQCGYNQFFEAEMIADALKTGSPISRAELWMWLAEKLPSIKVRQIPKEELVACLPWLYTNLEDRNADVRKNTNEAVLGFMLHLGYDAMVRNAEKLKPASRTIVVAALDKVRPLVPIETLPPAKSKSQKPAKSVKGGKPASAAPAKAAAKPKASSSRPSVVSRKKEEDVDTSPLLSINKLKYQRFLDEQKLKVLKWNFVSPREEFVDLLRDQMNSSGINKTLLANMFHSDFRYHLKALESLSEDLDENPDALIANLDLILKWLTLRFFDTNPSVLLKGLEYLNAVFPLLVDIDYSLADAEAASFIPYLVMKLGDPKDLVRGGVRSVVKQITYMYPVNKLFTYIMDGLKSKNARQRTECLDVLGALLENHGIGICQPSASSAMHEVAKQISDRDNSVRNAALNCVVQAYRLEGEKIYKLIGQISDKDASLLEERIKRAGKVRIAPKVSIAPTVRPTSKRESAYMERQPEPEPQEDDVEEEQDYLAMPAQSLSPMKVAEPPAPVQGPFSLDKDLLARLDAIPVRTFKLNLREYNLDFMYDETPKEKQTPPSVMPMSLPKRIDPRELTSAYRNASATSSTTSLSPTSQPTQQENILEKTITEMASADLRTALTAISLMEEVLRSNKANLMSTYEEQFMSAVLQQMRALRLKSLQNSDTLKGYRACLIVLAAFYESKVVGRQISGEVLGGMLEQLIWHLTDKQLSTLPDSDAYTKVINTLCVRLIERSDHTNVTCALIKLLHDCAPQGSASPRYVELVMKCLWKVVKLIPAWADDIDYDAVLLEVHIFLSHYPPAWWRQQPLDTPVRTIKTVVHTMVKARGKSILLHLTRIPNPSGSELQAYLIKILNSLKIEDTEHTTPVKKDTQKTLSKSTYNLLSEIFQKIGDKEATKEGLLLLYEFKEKHPEADVEPFLKRSSQFFQDYIEKGLKEIAVQKKKQDPTKKSEVAATIVSNEKPTSASSDDEICSYWMGRLQTLKKMAGEPVPIPPDFEINIAETEPEVDALLKKIQQIRAKVKLSREK